MANIFTTHLNLAIPSAGDINWDNEYSGFTQAMDDLGNLLSFAITVPDSAVNGMVFYDGFFPQESITVKAIGVFARTAPTGQDLKVDVIKNGTAQNNPGNLTSGIQFEKTVLSSSIGFLVTDRLGLKFSQVGSLIAGDKIVVTVYYQKEAIPSP
ncbi:MAG: hypothetical protein HOJ79_14545 [Nitrospina sp.]|jgi:hypothetical protein|nr:hypothetical protein [Nitrospina sp.]